MQYKIKGFYNEISSQICLNCKFHTLICECAIILGEKIIGRNNNPETFWNTNFNLIEIITVQMVRDIEQN